MTLLVNDFRSIRGALLEPAFAIPFAVAGIGGLGVRRIGVHRLSRLMAAAIGVLLAVNILEVLPDAKQFLGWPVLPRACASGYFLLRLTGKYVYHICPAWRSMMCTIEQV